MINVWSATDKELKAIKPGTRVYAGNPSDLGIWCGFSKGGTKVVAWAGNIKGRKDKISYVKHLMKYANA